MFGENWLNRLRGVSQGGWSLQILLPVICDLCSSLPPNAPPLPAKVTVNYYEEEGNMPIDQAGLFLTAIGKLVWLWPGCFPPQGLTLLPFSAALGLFPRLLTWHSELPLNNAGREVMPHVPRPFCPGVRDVLGGGVPGSAGTSPPMSASPPQALWATEKKEQSLFLPFLSPAAWRRACLPF